MTTTTTPTKYRVTFEDGRIARTRDNGPVDIAADLEHLCDAVHDYARPKCFSRGLDVVIDTDDNTGLVLAGMAHVAARFTFTPLMSVRVRDREGEKLPSGSWTSPLVRTVDIPATCRTCGGPRGVPGPMRQVDDGDWYTVDVWTNPCGHTDYYDAILHEAGVR